MAKIVIDLHPIFNDSDAIERALLAGIAEGARYSKIVEIIPGKGSGQLMQKVKRILRDPRIQPLFKRMKVDPNNHGRIFLYP